MFDSRRYQIFREVVGLERGPLSLVRIIEELLEWKSRGSGCRKPRLRPWRSVVLTTRQLALTSPTGCGCSVGIVRLRTKTTEFFFQFKPHKKDCRRKNDKDAVNEWSRMKPKYTKIRVYMQPQFKSTNVSDFNCCFGPRICGAVPNTLQSDFSSGLGLRAGTITFQPWFKPACRNHHISAVV
jgi:hypothetical protein